MTRRLEGKVALITGIGGGMGRTAALTFAREGARVVGCDIAAPGAEETVRLVRAAGGEIEADTGVDLADADASRAWVDAAATRFGGVDILYNNASTPRFGSVTELSVEDWRYVMDNELNLVFYASQAVWPHLVARGGGVIVNVGSIAGTRGVHFMPQNAHGTAKAGVINLTQQLAAEGGRHGIRVVCISPGFIVTPSTEWLAEDPPELLRATFARTPLSRMGRPDDVVNAALYLASDEASWVTGVNLVVDGGNTAVS